MSRPSAYDDAYPRELWTHERAHLRARVPDRELPADRPSDAVVGVALSGGGIRSATFCLGVFQALAELKRLAGIDYISTVSGGGYFGAFLGRLYRRGEIQNGEQVRALLDPTAAPAQRPAGMPDVVGWLRENGRYLSPNGAGDMLIAAAIMLRNWVTIQVVVLSFALLLLMTGQLPRLALDLWAPHIWANRAGGAASRLWWSPWIVLPVITVVWWAAPLAWAFWLTGRWNTRKKTEWPVWGLVITAAVAAGLAVSREPARWVGVAALSALAVTVAAWAIARHKARSDPADGLTEESRRLFEIDRQRNLLSTWLKFALVGTGALLAFALVDAVGQTLYLVEKRSHGGLVACLGSALTMLAGAAAFAQRIATALAGRGSGGGRLRLPVAAVVTTGALGVVALVLVSLSMLAHGLAWRFNEPSGAPAITWATPPPSRATVNAQVPQAAGASLTAATPLPVPGGCATPPCAPAGAGPHVRDRDDFRFIAVVWAIMIVFAFAFGRCWPFINQSSLHSMYSARLTRAYLGASNPRRQNVARQRVTEVAPGDNIDAADYWPAPEPQGDPRARPLHLINVTINETVDGRSNVQRQDRKGTGLALGPCAFSVGIRHHAVFPRHAVLRPRDASGSAPPNAVTIFPQPRAGAQGSGYRVFTETADGQGWQGGERLPVGAWTGISGAAFSTGLGARTNLGLSLLCGLTNVRLGYWWDSGAEPWRRSGYRRQWLLERMFRVQSYLLSEFVSRFYGTSRKHWYLSDGGHFENMGAYELIRRRLARIVLVDAEADPDYTFDGLANLVRKARLDFGAEIEFLTEPALDDALPASHRRLFGTLEQLRRGKWAQEPVKERLLDQLRLTVEEPVDRARHSLAHAALARVTFVDDPGWQGWLLYLKPTLVGDEPADLGEYHRAHSPFPQETTGDQFFDEAQWESYRMLGYHIARDVFRTSTVAATGPATAPPSPAVRIFGS